MNIKTKGARAYLKAITTKADFNKLIDDLLITEAERQVVEGIYLKGKTVDILSSDLGYASPTIKAMHKRVLNKVADFIER